jgi:hypothetical protein
MALPALAVPRLPAVMPGHLVTPMATATATATVLATASAQVL